MAYVVKPGDSFWAIAARELGDGRRWKEIAAENNLAGTDTIFAGQTLKIPGQESEEERRRREAEAAAVAPTPPTTSVTTQLPPTSTTGSTGGSFGMPVVRDPDGSIAFGEDEKAKEKEELKPAFNRESFRDIVRRELSFYGLESLTDFVLESLEEYDQIGPELFMARIRNTDQYKERFRGNELRRQAGLNVLNESQYIADETAYEAVLRNAGLPKGYYDSPDDFVQLIGGNVSPVELSSRVTEGYLAVSQADQSVRDEMRRLYGLTDGEMVAYYLDPQKALPIIEREVATARVGAAAARSGFSNVLDREALEQFAALGVTEQQAITAFGTLGAGRELLSPLEGGETALDVADTALGLAGQSPEALQRLRTQQRRRVARFEGGGSLGATAGGVTGLREA
jgi:hypothetical protein